MIINLLGPVIVHPYADPKEFVVLAWGAQEQTALYDGKVYRQSEAGKAAREIVLTYVEHPTEHGTVFRTVASLTSVLDATVTMCCRHQWVGESDNKLQRRITHMKFRSGVLVIDEGHKDPIILDLETTMTLEKPTGQSLWDHVRQGRI